MFSLLIFIIFAIFLFARFKYLTKQEISDYEILISFFWILIKSFIGFLGSLGERKLEFPSQGPIFWITSWCCNIEWIVQPDPYMSTCELLMKVDYVGFQVVNQYLYH